ncbi:MAG: hypothetical protein PHR77_02930 [Kiritimatiellae bacterium]|nr:hypothetical protein [Kiritimatiellia bacterium]MDD5519444.1 hypothetical protein [Kiritimatiellia bacterium]
MKKFGVLSQTELIKEIIPTDYLLLAKYLVAYFLRFYVCSLLGLPSICLMIVTFFLYKKGQFYYVAICLLLVGCLLLLQREIISRRRLFKSFGSVILSFGIYRVEDTGRILNDSDSSGAYAKLVNLLENEWLSHPTSRALPIIKINSLDAFFRDNAKVYRYDQQSLMEYFLSILKSTKSFFGLVAFTRKDMPNPSLTLIGNKDAVFSTYGLDSISDFFEILAKDSATSVSDFCVISSKLLIAVFGVSPVSYFINNKDHLSSFRCIEESKSLLTSIRELLANDNLKQAFEQCIYHGNMANYYALQAATYKMMNNNVGFVNAAKRTVMECPFFPWRNETEARRVLMEVTVRDYKLLYANVSESLPQYRRKAGQSCKDLINEAYQFDQLSEQNPDTMILSKVVSHFLKTKEGRKEVISFFDELITKSSSPFICRYFKAEYCKQTYNVDFKSVKSLQQAIDIFNDLFLHNPEWDLLQFKLLYCYFEMYKQTGEEKYMLKVKSYIPMFARWFKIDENSVDSFQPEDVTKLVSEISRVRDSKQ